MREIKFRGLTERGFVFGYLVVCSTNEGMRYGIKDTPYHVNDGCVNLIPSLIDEGTDVQYTGLKDKNGVEIYEGDLVLVREARICEVIFHKDAGCWDLTPRNIISSVSIGSVSPASYKYHAEVIGNIHQHPELIKGE